MSEQAHSRDPHEVLAHLAQQGPREEAFRVRLGAELAEAARQIPSQAGRKFDSVRTRMRRHRGLVAALAAAAVVVIAVTLAVTLSNLGGGVPSADAAILRSVTSALTPPAGTILHEQAVVTVAGKPTPQPFELWVQADSPQAYRVIKWGQEVSWNGTAYSIYDAGTNTIGVDPPVSRQPGHGPADVGAALRALVQSGQAKVVGSATIHGVPAYELSVSGAPADGSLNGTAYVAKSNFHPLLIETTDGGTISFQTYEYVPATQDNLKLLDLAAAHPGANVISETAQPSSGPSPASSSSK